MAQPSPATNRLHPTTAGLTLLAVIGLGLAVGANNSATVEAVSYRHVSTETPFPQAALTCGGETVDPAARIGYQTEKVIEAPLEVVWNLQTEVERWPSWQRAVDNVTRLDSGSLRPQSQFLWTTPVPATPVTPATSLAITSTVHEVEPMACIRWSGPAVGEGLGIDRGVHVWTFAEVPGGVLVRTEETWTGDQVDANAEMSVSHLGLGLEAWLDDLEAAATTRKTQHPVSAALESATEPIADPPALP